MNYSKTPTYNLKVILQEVDIKPDTLRAWERRYGLPKPKRTQGKHRLYSEHDIATIKWLLQRQQEGMSISRAVRLWHNLEETGQNPLEGMPIPLNILSTPPSSAPAPHTHTFPIAGSTVADFRQAWINACLKYDEQAAENALTQAFALYPADMVCLELLQKGLAHIGELWYRNEATVQQEHFASALAMRRLNTLVTAAPLPNRPGKIIVACPADEHHIFAPLFLTLMLRHHGWETIYLGANVPRDYLENTIATAKPDLIVMTAQQLHTAASLYHVAEFLHQERIPLAFGGRIFSQTPALRSRIPGHFLGEKLDTAVHAIAHILSNRPQIADPKTIAPEYQAAREHFRKRQAQIEAAVWQVLQQEDFPYEHLTNANLHLARDITAALTLGSVSFLGSEMAWTETLLLNYEMPPDLLRLYLTVYRNAARQILQSEGAPIVEWLDCITDQNDIPCD
ncbi:MAG: cobalamin B12-binding domain-containing protein [Ardenticatenaceae bacterium]|nr:cobalamin B12-binding domain-containing protein [Ardenticatenaceae bacterium]